MFTFLLLVNRVSLEVKLNSVPNLVTVNTGDSVLYADP